MTGNPAPGVRWLKNEQDFEPDGTRVKSFVQDDGIFGLVFETTVADDKGVYTAVAFNDEGMARSNANVAIKTRLKEGVERLVTGQNMVVQFIFTLRCQILAQAGHIPIQIRFSIIC